MSVISDMNELMVQNKPLLRQVVMVVVPALGFHTQRSQQEHMPFTTATLGNPVQCRVDDGKASFQASLERLLTLPATKAQKQQLKKQPRAAPKPPSDFALSLDKMRQMEYPMPVRIRTGLYCGSYFSCCITSEAMNMRIHSSLNLRTFLKY
jgi:hypothetical protein